MAEQLATSFMVALDEGFQRATHNDYQAMNALLRGEIPGRETDENSHWQGLRRRPFSWWKPLFSFLTAGQQEYHLPSLAKELSTEGGPTVLRDILRWAKSVDLLEVRFSGGGHPHEPENALVHPGPTYGIWKFTEGGPLSSMASTFRAASPEEIAALETLRRRTEGRNKSGDLLGDGLADQPFWYWRLIAYFGARGTRSCVLGEVEGAVIVRKPGTNRAVMHFGDIKAFLIWAHRKGVLNIFWEPRSLAIGDRDQAFTINTSALTERWGL